MADPLALIAEYRTRGLMLDANLLVLYVAGRHDRRLIPRLKATRSGFSDRDFVLVANIVASFDRLMTTPHVLTEVNGLLNTSLSRTTGLPRGLRWDVLGSFGEQIRVITEVYQPAHALSADIAFRRLGLADAGVLAAAVGGPLVISTDLDLCVGLHSRGFDAINYNDVRPL